VNNASANVAHNPITALTAVNVVAMPWDIRIERRGNRASRG
jgi:hypothetical protein